jgi:prevent-host-death family protein
MQVNMLEAKSQLSKLVKAAIAGEDVVIASHGQPQVRLVPCTAAPGLRQWGAWAGQSVDIDTAFSEESDAQALELFGLI